jgi:ABC-type transport system involved in multi-copper enzyme maturation permease subunit
VTFLPIVERELRVAARKRNTFWVRIVAALVGLMIGTGCILMSAVSGMGTAGFGSALFGILTWISLAAALSAGLFFTSDCLSEEKREGTLGLLFLTDLRGYDVVTGKLLVTSLRGCFGLLAIFPILAVTLLMGGVEGAHFGKASLALLNALFCSLAVGMFVSGVSRDSQRALAATVLLLLCLIFGGMIIDKILAWINHHPFRPILIFTSPAYPFTTADVWGRYLSWSPYWISLLITHGIGWALLLSASFLVPRTWQDKGRNTTSGSGLRRLRYGSVRRQLKVRRHLLDLDVVLWLACRERWQSLLVWAVTLLLLGGFITLVAKLARETWMGWQYLAWFFVLFFYLWAASQACRFFIDARRSGLIELLLASPITERQIVRGQWRAIMRLFGVPVVLLVAIMAGGGWLSQAAWQRISASIPTVPPAATVRTNSAGSTTVVYSVHIGTRLAVTNSATNTASGGFAPAITADQLSQTYLLIKLGGAVIGGLSVAANFLALFWFGMWMGMTSKTANTATAKTILFVHVIPWLCITFASGMVIAITMMSLAVRRSAGPPALFMVWYPFASVALTGLLTILKDVGFFLWARKKLYTNFREQAVRGFGVAKATVGPPPPIATG